jgi:signal transduction histidine kinase/CheY-like chemotaxis protein
MKADGVFPFEQAPWPALLVDAAGAVCQSNPVAVAAFGGLLNRQSSKLSSIWSPENSYPLPEFLAQAQRTPSSALVPVRIVVENGSLAAYFASACPVTVDGRKYVLLQLLPQSPTADSKNRVAETYLWHKQKLDCALQLARTVSLDFNNALTSILGHASHLLGKIQPNNPWRASLLEIEKSAARAAEISNDLGAFSRQEKDAHAQTSGNLNVVLQHCVEFFQKNPTPEFITWSLQLERNSFAARFDELKMQQVFIRIIENAVQAIRDQGRITVQTRNVELSEATQDRTVHLAPGAYVCAEVSDNGCGIEPEVLPRIFEPFFTTKKDKKHRGLGLAWVYGIVTNHGGGVAVSSQVGTGTSVRVYLPAEKRIVKDNGVPAGDLTGTEVILMVDDEDLLLTMGQTILSAYGYRVFTANSGQKALDLLNRPETQIDLLLADLVMPAMSGRELIEHVQRFAPSVRVLCTSGCIWPANQLHQRPYLQKPFTAQELLLKVKQTLSATEE